MTTRPVGSDNSDLIEAGYQLWGQREAKPGEAATFGRSGSSPRGLFRPSMQRPRDEKPKKPPKQGPHRGELIEQGLLSLPAEAYNSPRDFLGAGGATALLAPFFQGNFPALLGLKLLQGRFSRNRLKVGSPVPVAVVNFKDTTMDPYTLSQTTAAYSDRFSRRAPISGLQRYRR